jgi:hypothetical protein
VSGRAAGDRPHEQQQERADGVGPVQLCYLFYGVADEEFKKAWIGVFASVGEQMHDNVTEEEPGRLGVCSWISSIVRTFNSWLSLNVSPTPEAPLFNPV